MAEIFGRRVQEERAAALAKVYSGATEEGDDGEDCYVVPLPRTSVSCRVRKRDAARRYTLHPRPKPKKLKEKSLMAASARSFRESAEGERPDSRDRHGRTLADLPPFPPQARATSVASSLRSWHTKLPSRGWKSSPTAMASSSRASSKIRSLA